MDQLIDQAYQACTNLFEYYHAHMWHKPSFHNQHHLEAIRTLTDKFATHSDTHQVFDIDQDLNTWNQSHHTTITTDEFFQLLHLAFALHDSGNVATLKSPNKHNTQVPTYSLLDTSVYLLPHYTSADAEQRSIDIAQAVYHHRLDETQWQLVSHLITQTIFRPTPTDQPFHRLVATIDQLSSSLLRTDPYEAGLIAEIKAENPQAHIDMDAISSFTQVRTNILLSQPQQTLLLSL